MSESNSFYIKLLHYYYVTNALLKKNFKSSFISSTIYNSLALLVVEHFNEIIKNIRERHVDLWYIFRNLTMN